ncbi:hypothetical protein ACHAO8_005964 [Botrytis cinerea]
MRKYRHGKILKTVIEHAESPDGGDEKNDDEADNDGEGVEDTDEEVLEDMGRAEVEVGDHGYGYGHDYGSRKERGNRGRDGGRGSSGGDDEGKDAKLHVRECEKEFVA